MDRALLVGINAYPNAPLRGCINDVNDMRSFLMERYGFLDQDIKLLSDKSATKSGIEDGLKWLMDASGAGNRLLFHYSGHGTQMALDRQTIVDSICPYNFDFTLDHALNSIDFTKIFSAIPEGTEFNWISDSCFSGDLTRLIMPDGALPRYIPPPAEVQQAIVEALDTTSPRVFRFETSSPLNGGFISGCGANETSADAVFSGRSNGAFTYCLLECLKEIPASSLTNLCSSVISDLRYHRYTQTPVVKGSSSITSQAFLGGARGLDITAASRMLSSLRSFYSDANS